MRRSLLTAVSAILLALQPALADDVGPDRVRALVAGGHILPLEEILKRNENSVSGRIIEIELEEERSGFVYEIKVLKPDGRRRKLEIDARTGDVLRDK